MGVAVEELQPHSRPDQSAPLDAQLKWLASDRRRKSAVEQAKDAYRQHHVTETSPTENAHRQDDSERRHNEWSTVAQARDEKNRQLMQRKSESTAKRLIYRLQSEKWLEESERKRKERVEQLELRRQQQLEERQQRTEEKQEEARRRIEQVLATEKRIMDDKVNRYNAKKAAQQEAQRRQQQQRELEATERHQMNLYKEQMREAKKQKAKEDLEAQREMFLQRLESGEQTLKRVLNERDQVHREKQRALQQRNEAVAKAVERQKDAEEVRKQLLLEKTMRRDEKTAEMQRHKEEYMRKSRQITIGDAQMRKFLAQWMDRIQATGRYDIPKSTLATLVDLDLAPLISVLEEQKQHFPDLNFDGMIQMAKKAANYTATKQRKGRSMSSSSHGVSSAGPSSVGPSSTMSGRTTPTEPQRVAASLAYTHPKPVRIRSAHTKSERTGPSPPKRSDASPYMQAPLFGTLSDKPLKVKHR
uniref:Uncharacterized protein n=1 Tax=Eutreptiella gymnastica TaxID=73025 RepID=A0A7S4G6E0_9EUGL